MTTITKNTRNYSAHKQAPIKLANNKIVVFGTTWHLLDPNGENPQAITHTKKSGISSSIHRAFGGSNVTIPSVVNHDGISVCALNDRIIFIGTDINYSFDQGNRFINLKSWILVGFGKFTSNTNIEWNLLAIDQHGSNADPSSVSSVSGNLAHFMCIGTKVAVSKWSYAGVDYGFVSLPARSISSAGHTIVADQLISVIFNFADDDIQWVRDQELQGFYTSNSINNSSRWYEAWGWGSAVMPLQADFWEPASAAINNILIARRTSALVPHRQQNVARVDYPLGISCDIYQFSNSRIPEPLGRVTPQPVVVSSSLEDTFSSDSIIALERYGVAARADHLAGVVRFYTVKWDGEVIDVLQDIVFPAGLTGNADISLCNLNNNNIAALLHDNGNIDSAGKLKAWVSIWTGSTWTDWVRLDETVYRSNQNKLHIVEYGTPGHAIISNGTNIYSIQWNENPNAPQWLQVVDGDELLIDPTTVLVRDIESTLLLDWDFQDIITSDTQSAYALRKQYGSTVRYWNASTNRWVAGEVKNSSTEHQVTLPANWHSNVNDDLRFFVKVWDTADLPSEYSTALLIDPAVSPRIAITKPSTVTPVDNELRWRLTRGEQTDYQLSLRQTDGTEIWNSGWINSDMDRALIQLEPTVSRGNRKWAVRVRHNEELVSPWVEYSIFYNWTVPDIPVIEFQNKELVGMLLRFNDISRVDINRRPKSSYQRPGLSAKDNQTVLIADNYVLDSSKLFTDYPPFNVEFEYAARGVSSVGIVSDWSEWQ